jgi:ligand-binding SRPBCC domain-containing protein
MHQLKRKVILKHSLEEAWRFFSNPKNLKIITPDYMGFDITSELDEEMYEGMIISYKVSPLLGIKMDWMTEITHIKDKTFFVDEQRIGPYKLWHHQHHFKQVENGVEMTDIVHYAAPMGFLGKAVEPFLVRPKLKEIFDYREKKMKELRMM